MGEVDLAQLQEAVLDGALLDALVADLTGHSRVLDVLVKGSARQRTDNRPLPLAEAVDLLRSGQVRGVQVRYRFDGDEWRDTLMATPAGIRLVRMRMDRS